MTEIENIRQEISETASALTAKVNSLESRARDSISPLHQIQTHPFLAAGLSLCAGVVVGSQLPHARRALEPFAIGMFATLAGEVGKKYFPSASPQISQLQDSVLR